MERAELGVHRRLARAGHVGRAEELSAKAWSLLRFARRCMLVRLGLADRVGR